MSDRLLMMMMIAVLSGGLMLVPVLDFRCVNSFNLLGSLKLLWLYTNTFAVK
jgi:uncharacterized metal-binding protein